jgi:hypothetical protein
LPERWNLKVKRHFSGRLASKSRTPEDTAKLIKDLFVFHTFISVFINYRVKLFFDKRNIPPSTPTSAINIAD